MSYEGYQEARSLAWQLARETHELMDSSTISVRTTLIDMWTKVAHMELMEPDKPGDWLDRWAFGRPVPDPGTVGRRCSECRHFEDNHAPACRECNCMGVSSGCLKGS